MNGISKIKDEMNQVYDKFFELQKQLVKIERYRVAKGKKEFIFSFRGELSVKGAIRSLMGDLSETLYSASIENMTTKLQQESYVTFDMELVNKFEGFQFDCEVFWDISNGNWKAIARKLN